MPKEVIYLAFWSLGFMGGVGIGQMAKIMSIPASEHKKNMFLIPIFLVLVVLAGLVFLICLVAH